MSELIVKIVRVRLSIYFFLNSCTLSLCTMFMENKTKKEFVTRENPITLEIHTIKKSIFEQMLPIESEGDELGDKLKGKIVGFAITTEKKYFDEIMESVTILWLITNDARKIKLKRNKLSDIQDKEKWIFDLPQIFVK